MVDVKSSAGFVSLKDGAKLFYEQVGDHYEKTLLCIPGSLASTRTNFSYQLDNLSKFFNIVAFDPRGYGKSNPLTKREFSTQMFHQDALDAVEIMEKLGYERYHVFGWSAGGIVGMILAAKYPNRVESLIVGGTMAFVTKADISLMETVDQNKLMVMTLPILQLYGEEEFMNLGSKLHETTCAIADKPDGDVCIQEVKEIKCRTLIIHCELDELVTKIHSEYLHKNISGSTLHIEPNEGHCFIVTKPEKINELVKYFLVG